MKRIIAATLIACMMLVLTACGDGPVGYWKIGEMSDGDVVMTEENLESIGLTSLGAIKLQKSGKCVVDLLGVESEGTWSQAEDGKITINYQDKSTFVGTLGEDGVMALDDTQGTTLKLHK